MMTRLERRSLYQALIDTIAKTYILKYLVKGAPCSPISKHWCYLIAVTDALICLLAILQLYHLCKIYGSYSEIISPLKHKHRRNVEYKREKKELKKQQREQQRAKKAHKNEIEASRRRMERQQKSQRRARQGFEYPRRPEKFAFHGPYAEDKNAIMMRDVRSQGQQHPKHRQQFYPEQYDTRRMPNAQTRTKTARTRPTGSTRSKQSKRSNNTKHQVWYGQPVQGPVHSTGGQQRLPPAFINSGAPSTTHHRQPPNNVVQGRHDARNMSSRTVVARPPPYTERDINLDHFSPAPPPRTRQNPRYDNTADHRGAAPPPRTTRYREQDFATGMSHHGAAPPPQTRPYLQHNMNMDQYATTLPPRTAPHPQHNAMIDHHTTAPPPRMAPYPEHSDILDHRVPAPPPSSRHRNPPVRPVAQAPTPSTQPPSTGASSSRGRRRVAEARMPKIPRVRSREGPNHPVPHERALREPSPCSTDSGLSEHRSMEVSPMTSHEDLRTLIARAHASHEGSLSSADAVAGSTGNPTPVVSRATSHETLNHLTPHEDVLGEPSPHSTNTDSTIADPTEHPPIPVITITDFDLDRGSLASQTSHPDPTAFHVDGDSREAQNVPVAPPFSSSSSSFPIDGKADWKDGGPPPAQDPYSATCASQPCSRSPSVASQVDHDDSSQHRGDRDSVWSWDSLASNRSEVGHMDAGQAIRTDNNGSSERLSDRASMRSTEIHNGIVPSPVIDSNSSHDRMPEEEPTGGDHPEQTVDTDHLGVSSSRPSSRDSGIRDCLSEEERRFSNADCSSEEERK